jgi:hypothetical protein
LWLAAQPIAGTLVEIYPRSRGISLLPDPDVLDDLIAKAPEVPADVLAILKPAKADILRILKWSDPAQAPSETGGDQLQRGTMGRPVRRRLGRQGDRLAEDKLFAMPRTCATNAASVCW